MTPWISKTNHFINFFHLKKVLQIAFYTICQTFSVYVEDSLYSAYIGCKSRNRFEKYNYMRHRLTYTLNSLKMIWYPWNWNRYVWSSKMHNFEKGRKLKKKNSTITRFSKFHTSKIFWLTPFRHTTFNIPIPRWTWLFNQIKF